MGGEKLFERCVIFANIQKFSEPIASGAFFIFKNGRRIQLGGVRGMPFGESRWIFTDDIDEVEEGLGMQLHVRYEHELEGSQFVNYERYNTLANQRGIQNCLPEHLHLCFRKIGSGEHGLNLDEAFVQLLILQPDMLADGEPSAQPEEGEERGAEITALLRLEPERTLNLSGFSPLVA